MAKYREMSIEEWTNACNETEYKRSYEAVVFSKIPGDIIHADIIIGRPRLKPEGRTIFIGAYSLKKKSEREPYRRFIEGECWLYDWND